MVFRSNIAFEEYIPNKNVCVLIKLSLCTFRKESDTMHNETVTTMNMTQVRDKKKKKSSGNVNNGNWYFI